MTKEGFPLKQMFLSTGKEFKEIETFEPGAWIHLVNPSQEEALKVAERFNIEYPRSPQPLWTWKKHHVSMSKMTTP